MTVSTDVETLKFFLSSVTRVRPEILLLKTYLLENFSIRVPTYIADLFSGVHQFLKVQAPILSLLTVP
jgi:hypothetical protein